MASRASIPNNPFILVDGSSYLFRAYHALPPLTNSQGNPTGAIYGVVNMLRKLIADYHPTHMAVVFDSKGKNFRHELYTPYKANRTVMPDELQQQIEPLHALVRAFGLPLIIVPGVEADDVIGTLAIEAKKKGMFTLISTGDKDFAQLVDDKIFLINTMSGEIYNRDRVIEKFEVAPENILDYFALVGDSVDNIPGVPKVGPKTAVKWLQEYGTLAEIIKKAKDIPGKVGENLRDALPQLPLFRELVTIKIDLPLDYHPKDLQFTAPDKEGLKELFTTLEFKTWLRDLDKISGESAGASAKSHSHIETQSKVSATTVTSTTSARSATKVVSATPEDSMAADTFQAVEYKTIISKKEFEQWFVTLEKSKLFAFSIKTNHLDKVLEETVGMSFATMPGHAIYLPFEHHGSDNRDRAHDLSEEWVLKKLKPILEDKQKTKVGHNLKFVMEQLLKHNIKLAGTLFDTMLESYIINSTARHDLDSLALNHLKHQSMTYEEIAGKGAKQIPFSQVPLEKAGFYACETVDIAFRVHHKLWTTLEKLPKQKQVFETIEMPLASVLAAMEFFGVLIDSKKLQAQSKELGEKLLDLETECYKLAGKEFNINSPKQLQEVLFVDLKLPVLEKTPTGQPSTAEAVLQELSQAYLLPKMILEYRSLSKLKSTYTDKLPNEVDPKTGRIHTSYHQAITTTGRLSSTEPNLQNIPIRTAEGRKVRMAFIPTKGYKMVSADYSQVELRIMAHMSQDAGLVKAFSMGDDVHRSTAAAVFGVPLEKVTEDQRRSAKVINFGLMYGMSVFGLAKQMGIERQEAEKQVQRYFDCFPGVKSFMESIRTQATEQGFVETVLGRRLYLPDLKAHHAGIRKAAERAAINAPMQGTNADIIKLAMIKLDNWIREERIDAHMIMQVHDELVFEVSEKIVDDFIPHIKNIMENILPLSVKLQVGVGLGNNWDEAH